MITPPTGGPGIRILTPGHAGRIAEYAMNRNTLWQDLGSRKTDVDGRPEMGAHVGNDITGREKRITIHSRVDRGSLGR